MLLAGAIFHHLLETPWRRNVCNKKPVQCENSCPAAGNEALERTSVNQYFALKNMAAKAHFFACLQVLCVEVSGRIRV